MTNATSFGKQASTYAKGRPGYPSELYQWISQSSNAHDLVWDVGTGSGQAAHALTEYFAHVHATDLSSEQIEAATPHPQITYLAVPAHLSRLKENSIDAVTVATALHWFATDDFWKEVGCVAKPDALFAAWTYQLPHVYNEAQSEFLTPLLDLIDPYWANGNRICMAGYTKDALNCPYPKLTTPEFDAGGIWTGRQLFDFAQSWSAHFRARQDGLQDALNKLSQNFLEKYGKEEMLISLPISLLAARIRR